MKTVKGATAGANTRPANKRNKPATLKKCCKASSKKY